MSGAGALEVRASSLGRNLLGGVKLAFFLRVGALDFRAAPLDFVLLVALDMAVWILAAAARAGFEGAYDPAALPTYLAGVLLVLAVALAVSVACRDRGRLMLIAVALVASDPVFELVGVALPPLARAIGNGAVLLAVFLAWSWLVSVRAVLVAAGRGRRQLVAGALAVSAMTAISLAVFPQIDAWQPPQEEEATPLAEEEVFHAQGELIERALAAIRRGRPGVPELYFVGFAPDASQDVFLHEMRFVKRLFDERFGAAGRSIALVSSEAALEELPIATVTNLRRALERVGEAMNPDEDVLFLYITAHGGLDHALSAVQPPLEVMPLTPTALARMLQDAGIKWRVIVVSACYSGGFIEPLRDANTLVITAAAADRSSFGCESGRDFTYFGEAYFREALARTRSFAAAFDLAKGIVARQEAAEKLAPSEPQIWLGEALAGQLRHLPLTGEKPHP
ncbi:MAG TPA: C13 family peptidase [Usitatibacter sp.]|nr:C13 family peptidase [Usitatibacter sp.]